MHTKEAKLGRKEKGSVFFFFLSSLSIRHAKDLPLPGGLLYRGLLYKCNSGKVVVAYDLCFTSTYGNSLLQKFIWEMHYKFHTQSVSPYLSAEVKLTWTFWPRLLICGWWAVSKAEKYLTWHICKLSLQFAGNTGWNINYWCLQSGIWKTIKTRDYTEPSISGRS